MIYDGRELNHPSGLKVVAVWDERARELGLIGENICPTGNQWVCKLEDDWYAVFINNQKNFAPCIVGFIATREEINSMGWNELIDFVPPQWTIESSNTITISQDKLCICDIHDLMRNGCASNRGEQCNSR